MKTLLIPDLHVPDEDPEALEWALSLAQERKPDEIIFLGDVVDFVSISRFLKHPRFRHLFRDEVKAGCAMVRRLVRQLPKEATVRIKAGNHEQRLEHYLWKHAPELADEPGLTVPALLGFPETWEYSPPGQHHIMSQGVMVMHGRKFSGNVALANLRKYMCSVVQGHSHRASVQYTTVADNRLLSSAECGCLQRKNPTYAGVTDWVHAVGWITDGLVTLEVKP